MPQSVHWHSKSIGYVSQWQRIGARVEKHSTPPAITRLLGKPWQGDAQVFRATKSSFGGASVETHQRLTVEGDWTREQRTTPTGALFVPITQPKARLVMALLEPKAPDSLLAWGRFNNAFERKEYMEDYVAEEVARDQFRHPDRMLAFAMLEPYVAEWALRGEKARAQKRVSTPIEVLRAFQQALLPHLRGFAQTLQLGNLEAVGHG